MKGRRWYAGFIGEEKRTAWYRSKGKAIEAMRKGPMRCPNSATPTIRGQFFVEPKPELKPSAS